jgi:hypothetical protein
LEGGGLAGCSSAGGHFLGVFGERKQGVVIERKIKSETRGNELERSSWISSGVDIKVER